MKLFFRHKNKHLVSCQPDTKRVEYQCDKCGKIIWYHQPGESDFERLYTMTFDEDITGGRHNAL